MASFMRVIRPWASRFAIGLVAALLAGAGLAVRTGLAVTTALSGLLEDLGQWLEARRAAWHLRAARRAKAADRWRAAFEAAPLPMAKVSLDGRLEEVNPAFCTLLGEPERALLSRRLSALVYPDDLVDLVQAGALAWTKGVSKDEVRLVCAGGRLRWCELATSVLHDAEGRAENLLVNVVDITRHKRSQAALRDLATRDPLSGLANRRWFELQLAQHMRACADEGPRGALLVMDLDNFKAVNDTLGHQAGDRLVIEVAVTLRRHLRDQDLVARLGGDEFAIVLHDGDGWAAEAVARKLVLAVRDEVRTDIGALGEAGEPARARGSGEAAGLDEASGGGGAGSGGEVAVDLRDGGVTMSVGVAPFELLPGIGAREALKAADAAMYAVKRSGRSGYAVVGAAEGPHHARRRRGGVPDLSARQASLSGAPQP
jgi:diguanylate cyclase (GGDEF)-like protein/PAS domain S-box-containing protein